MLSCKESSKLVSESLDRPLTWKERINLKIHLMMCRLCTNYARQITFITTSARKYLQYTNETQQQDLKLTEERRQRIKQAIEQQTKFKDEV